MTTQPPLPESGNDPAQGGPAGQPSQVGQHGQAAAPVQPGAPADDVRQVGASPQPGAYPQAGATGGTPQTGATGGTPQTAAYGQQAGGYPPQGGAYPPQGGADSQVGAAGGYPQQGAYGPQPGGYPQGGAYPRAQAGPNAAQRVQPKRGPGAFLWIAVIVAIIGVLVIASLLIRGVFAATASNQDSEEHLTASVAGVQGLDIQIAAADLTVVYADVPDARLDVVSRGTEPRDWALELEGDVLTVTDTPRGDGPDWWFGPAFDVDATLTLPRALETAGLETEVRVQAGKVTLPGDFASLRATVEAGEFDFTGKAASLSTTVAAGRAVISAEVLGEVDFETSAGEIIATLTGPQPATVRAEVSAGSTEITLPVGDYAVRTDVSAGEADIGFQSVPGATHTIDVQVSAGSISIDQG